MSSAEMANPNDVDEADINEMFSPDDPMSIYAYLSVAELRKQCKELGLSAVGSKAELIKRLYTYEHEAEEESDFEDSLDSGVISSISVPESENKLSEKSAFVLAQKGFGADPNRYEKGRPEYDANTIAFFLAQLGVGSGQDAKRVICEIGAGTGKFTKLLMEHTGKNTDVLALEPIRAMRALIPSHPRLKLIEGRAESLPLRESSVDCIICAQSFHWFASPMVLKEFLRVLVPGGSLGLIWNTKDTSQEQWLAEVEDYCDTFYENEPRQKTGQWKAAFLQIDPHQTGVPFTPLNFSQFQQTQHGDANMVIDRFLSASAIARRSSKEKAEIEANIRSILSR